MFYAAIIAKPVWATAMYHGEPLKAYQKGFVCRRALPWGAAVSWKLT